MGKKAKLILKGISEESGQPFKREIRTLDEVRESGQYTLVGYNVSEEEGLPPAEYDDCNYCFIEALLSVTRNSSSSGFVQKETIGQTITISNREDGGTNIYNRSWSMGKNNEEWTPWLMMLRGDISVVAPTNDLNEKVSVVAESLRTEKERAENAEKGLQEAIDAEAANAKLAHASIKSDITEQSNRITQAEINIRKTATVRFDRIEENEAEINKGEIGIENPRVVYYKPENIFVAVDNAGNYWDTWQGMDAYMSGGVTRKDKVYICQGTTYVLHDTTLQPTTDGLSNSDSVNAVIKELYADIDYRDVIRVRIVCGWYTNEKYYNAVYLRGANGVLALYEQTYSSKEEAISAFSGYCANGKMSFIIQPQMKEFSIDVVCKLLKPINIPLSGQSWDALQGLRIVTTPIVGNAVKELFIENNGIELPPLYIRNLRNNNSGRYVIQLKDEDGNLYFGFDRVGSLVLTKSVIKLDDIKGLGINCYVVIDWSFLEEGKYYQSEKPINNSVFNIASQPSICSYLNNESLETKISKEIDIKVSGKVDSTYIVSKNLYNKADIIYGQAISFSTTNDTIISIDTKWETGATSDFIPVEPLETYYLYRGYNGNNEVFTFVAADKMTLLRPIDPDTDTELSVEECRNKNRAYKAPANAAYAIFTIALSNATAEKASLFQFEVGPEYTGYVDFYQRYVAYPNLPIELEYRHNYPDKLWGKKYVACGDSFTAGDFTGDTTEDYIFTEGKFAGKKKVYPYFIGMRNNMEVTNEAISGSIMALDKTYVADPENIDINTRRPFSYERYKKIPADADYITLWFGINDSANTNLGTIDDATNETFYGAWNVVMEYLITNHPYAKIGIIITNSGKAEYREAEREIARKWGIPFLDMMGDEQVPPIFGRETSLGLSSRANTLRRNNFVVSSSNSHPNQYAHEYESTFIEEFLRRL